MSTDPRIFSLVDDLEGLPFDSAFRIPPLQDPIPFIPSYRPSPLEPIARVNDGTRNATAKLSSRPNALAEAKPIGEDESASPYQRNKAAEAVSTKTTSSGQEARKRQKLDFVQLPEPKARSKANKPPSFRPVPVLLNELHEPPPSAALFPPITPTVLHDGDGQLRPDESQPHDMSGQAQPRQNNARKIEVAPERQQQQGRAKRVCLRGRRNWTDEETEDLLKGVGIYGIGKWKKILHHDGFSFHPERTTVDLKDRSVSLLQLSYRLDRSFRYRTCRLNEERALERQASGRAKTKPAGVPAENASKVTPLPLAGAESCKTPNTKKPRTPSDQSFSIFTPQSFSQSALSPRTRKDSVDKDGKNKMAAPRWTLEEDANLSKGYQKYGFQWTAITKDPDMKLNHRTGAQVRDRFRLKFPAHYQASVPLPLPEVAKKAPRAGVAQSAEDDGQTLGSQDKHMRRSVSKTPPSGQFTFIVHDPSKPSDQERTRAPRVTSVDTEQSSKAQSASKKSELSLHIERDVFHGLNVQPLPDPDPAPSSESTPPASPTTGGRSRQTSAEAEDARHLGILGLLNDEDEQNSRLPPFKYPFDDDWGGSSVTLPPLLWEDIASRPIFDLE